MNRPKRVLAALCAAGAVGLVACGGSTEGPAAEAPAQDKAAAGGQTPTQAYSTIKACFTEHGATKVAPQGGGEGMAVWGADATLSGHWASWSYATDATGKVLGVLTANAKLTPEQKATVKLCTA